MKNSADLEGCYPPWLSTSVDNNLLDLQNSSYPTQPYSIIAKYLCIWGSKRAAILSVFCNCQVSPPYIKSQLYILHVITSPDSLSSTTTAQANGLDNISALLLKDAADLLN